MNTTDWGNFLDIDLIESGSETLVNMPLKVLSSEMNPAEIRLIIKGTVSRDFLLLVFFMNQFPPSPRVFH